MRPSGKADRIRRQLAQELIADVRRHNFSLTANTEQIQELLEEHPTTLTEIVGIGPVLVARILAGTDDQHRFPTAAAFASYCGTAQIPSASADYSPRRLSRYGNRA